jgi:hypothetical protein
VTLLTMTSAPIRHLPNAIPSQVISVETHFISEEWLDGNSSNFKFGLEAGTELYFNYVRGLHDTFRPQDVCLTGLFVPDTHT